MKKIFSISILFVIISSAFAEKGLVVTQKYQSGNQQATVTWFVTAARCKMKMEINDGKVSTVNWFIPDTKNSQLFIYTEGAVPSGAQKAYYSVPVQEINADKSLDVSRMKTETTGETKTISGMVCEKVVITTNKNTTEMWVAKDFKANFYSFFPYFQNSFALAGLNDGKIQGFPLSSVTKDKTGKEIDSYQLISANTSELTESDFTVPAEYKSAEEISKKK